MAKKKSPRKKKAAASHPTYRDMIRKAIGGSRPGPQGASRAKIKNYILANFKVTNGAHTNGAIRRALASGMADGFFRAGATAQRFKLGDAAKKAPDAAKKAKKRAAAAARKKKAAATKKKKAAE